MPSLNLSENDRAVLNSIFNPSQPLGENAFEEDSPDILDGIFKNMYFYIYYLIFSIYLFIIE